MIGLRLIGILVAAVAALPLALPQAATAAPSECQPITFGPTGVAGSIAPGDETDCWRFDGAAGDRVRVRVIKTGGTGFSPRWEVRRPNDTIVCGPTSLTELTCLLDTTGTHTILVRDYAGTNTGDYKLSIQRLNDPVGCAPLGYATSSAAGGSIAPGDETDCWRFDGAAGDRVRVRLIKTGGGTAFSPRFELLRPNGTTLCGPTSLTELTCQLDTTGTHTILVRDYAGTNQGDYKVCIQLESPSGPPACPLVLEGEGGTGDGQVMPRSAASGFKTVWLHAGESRRFAFELPAAGRYGIRVRYSNDNFGRGEVVAVSVDGQSVDQFEAQDTGDRGHGWNVFAEAAVGSVVLAAGAHELIVEVSGGDGYGVEIDSVTLTPEM